MAPLLLARRAATALLVALAVVPAAAQELPPDAEFLREIDAADTGAAASITESTSVDVRSAGPWGFDLAGMDRSVKPGDNFAEFAGGAWMKRTQIPPDRARYGAFDMLRELSERRVIGLLQDLSRNHAILPAEATPEAIDRVKLAGLFASYLDQAEADRKDAGPIQPTLAEIRGITTPRDMTLFMGRSQGTLAGGESLVRAFVNADQKNPDFNTLYLGQGRLGLR